jgi:parallel beta-helix repeat protein
MPSYVRKLLTIAAMFSLALSSTAFGRTFYLAPNGNDDAEAVSGAEFATLRKALGTVWYGDTLIIRNGFYPGGATLRRGCPPDRPIVIRGESRYAIITGSGTARDGLTLADCSNVILDGVNVTRAERGGIVLSHSDHIQVRNCVAYNNGKWGIFTDFASDWIMENNECFGSQVEHGIYHSNSGDNFVFRNNYLHHNSGCGLHMNGDPDYGGDGVEQFGLVEGNLCEANGATLGGAAINMTHVQDVIVRNNVVLNTLAGGITFYQDTGEHSQGSKRALIMHNTLINQKDRGRTGVNIMPTSEKAVIVNNIFVVGGHRGAIEVNSDYMNTIISDNNVLWGSASDAIIERDRETRISFDAWRQLSGQDAHTVIADPGFVSYAYGDLHLTKNSPAVGIAMGLEEIKARLRQLGGFDWTLKKLAELPDVDRDGVQRPAGKGRDAGAYEYK